MPTLDRALDEPVSLNDGELPILSPSQDFDQPPDYVLPLTIDEPDWRQALLDAIIEH